MKGVASRFYLVVECYDANGEPIYDTHVYRLEGQASIAQIEGNVHVIHFVPESFPVIDWGQYLDDNWTGYLPWVLFRRRHIETSRLGFTPR